MIWEEAVVTAHFNTMCQHFIEENEENYIKPKLGQPVPGSASQI
jgi:hypothetical protein